jgi:transcriptional regulator with XRE-family HTH domain
MFCDQLKVLRANDKSSQKQLAEILGVSPQLIWKWETDKASPSPDMLKKIADYFNVSSDYLIGTNISLNDKLSVEIQALIAETSDLSPEGIEEIRKYAQLVKLKEKTDKQNDAEFSAGHEGSG